MTRLRRLVLVLALAAAVAPAPASAAGTMVCSLELLVDVDDPGFGLADETEASFEVAGSGACAAAGTALSLPADVPVAEPTGAGPATAEGDGTARGNCTQSTATGPVVIHAQTGSTVTILNITVNGGKAVVTGVDQSGRQVAGAGQVAPVTSSPPTGAPCFTERAKRFLMRLLLWLIP